MKRWVIGILLGCMLGLTTGAVSASWADHFPAPHSSGPGASVTADSPIIDTVTPTLRFTPTAELTYVYIYAEDEEWQTLDNILSGRHTPVLTARVSTGTLTVPAGVLQPGKKYSWYVESIHAPGSKSEAICRSQSLYFTTPAML